MYFKCSQEAACNLINLFVSRWKREPFSQFEFLSFFCALNVTFPRNQNFPNPIDEHEIEIARRRRHHEIFFWNSRDFVGSFICTLKTCVLVIMRFQNLFFGNDFTVISNWMLKAVPTRNSIGQWFLISFGRLPPTLPFWTILENEITLARF